ncbi:MAG: fibronectin type III-like domain-contianing protein [Tannerellaceae bacterium]|nr:fibronectin type III-like domain-contianing protein [Tannerellaceae bacterium]
MVGRTYRYLSSQPLYPFGYGLSYTTFSYQHPRLTCHNTPDSEPQSDFSVTDTLLLSFTVTNTGKIIGDDVPQLYLLYPDHPQEPRRALKAFRRIHLEAGQSDTLSFRLTPYTLLLPNLRRPLPTAPHTARTLRPPSFFFFRLPSTLPPSPPPLKALP